MDLNGSGDDGGWSLDDIKRYFTLQRYLPKNGGLFGSGWAHRRPPSPDDIARANQARCRALGLPGGRGSTCV